MNEEERLKEENKKLREQNIELRAKNELKTDVIKLLKKANKTKNRIIAIMAVCMCIMAVSFVIYESQFYIVEETQDEEGVSISTDGDNANAEYNDVEGNQYNDSATHEDYE